MRAEFPLWVRSKAASRDTNLVPAPDKKKMADSQIEAIRGDAWHRG